MNNTLTDVFVDVDPIALMVGGSHLYALNNENSDIDKRGIYGLTNISDIIGLNIYTNRSYESKVETSDEVDVSLHEFRKFIYLLSKTNTSAIEFLYAPNDAFIYKTDMFDDIRHYKEKLISTYEFYRTMRGYLQNEIRLTLGERTGVLGGARRKALEKYGYSYKNLVHCIRLLEASKTFFRLGYFPINVRREMVHIYSELMDIKNNPSMYNNETARKRINGIIDELDDAYASRKFNYTFNEDLANELIGEYYKDTIIKTYL